MKQASRGSGSRLQYPVRGRGPACDQQPNEVPDHPRSWTREGGPVGVNPVPMVPGCSDMSGLIQVQGCFSDGEFTCSEVWNGVKTAFRGVERERGR
jgi:hypothetical protein